MRNSILLLLSIACLGAPVAAQAKFMCFYDKPNELGFRTHPFDTEEKARDVLATQLGTFKYEEEIKKQNLGILDILKKRAIWAEIKLKYATEATCCRIEGDKCFPTK